MSGVLPIHYLLAPTLLVVGAVVSTRDRCCRCAALGTAFVFAAVWVVIARYLHWRLFTTGALPAEGAWYEVGWIWFCFAVEFFRSSTHSSSI